jgi:hypothetical protein
MQKLFTILLIPHDAAFNAALYALYIAPFSFKTHYNLSVQYSLSAEQCMRKDDYNLAHHSLSVTPGYSFSDDTFTNSLGLIYTIFKNVDITGQLTYTRDNANISTYDYDRYVASIGIEYRF